MGRKKEEDDQEQCEDCDVLYEAADFEERIDNSPVGELFYIRLNKYLLKTFCSDLQSLITNIEELEMASISDIADGISKLKEALSFFQKVSIDRIFD